MKVFCRRECGLGGPSRRHNLPGDSLPFDPRPLPRVAPGRQAAAPVRKVATRPWMSGHPVAPPAGEQLPGAP